MNLIEIRQSFICDDFGETHAVGCLLLTPPSGENTEGNRIYRCDCHGKYFLTDYFGGKGWEISAKEAKGLGCRNKQM